jgi:NUMOD4 motif/HNH endonuclease
MQTDCLLNEEWQPVVGYEGYYTVSNLGRVRSEQRYVTNNKDGGKRLVRSLILKQQKDINGYFVVCLYTSQKRKVCRVSILVAQAFVGPRPIGLDVCHNDGNRANNLASNLRYDTRKGNMADALAQGTTCKGEKHGLSRLTEHQVRWIRQDPRTLDTIAHEYGISFQHVSQIKRRIRWQHVD